MSQLAPSYGKTSFRKHFPWADEGLVDLVQSMTEFNPGFRPTAKECMQNPVFDSIRNARFETEAPY